MRARKLIERWAFTLACLGLIIPQHVVCAQQPDGGLRIVDVALDAQGRFCGQVVDVHGQPVVGTEVFLVRDGADAIATQTSDQGTFDVDDLQGGVYHLHVAAQSHVLRVWASQTAPPAAMQGVTVVAGDVVRGQSCTTGSCTGIGGCGGGMWGFLTNPWVIGAAVAAAIAIPLALRDDDDDDAS